MLKKIMLAGLMAATVLGGAVPASAQVAQERGDRPDGRDRGARGDWGDRNPRGNAMGQRWQQRGDDGPSRVSAPPAPGATVDRGAGRPGDFGARDRQVQQRGGWTGQQGRQAQQWRDQNRDTRRDGRQDDRQDWRGDRRDGRRDNARWNDRRTGNGDNWNGRDRVGVRRFDDRTRWSSQRRWDNGWRQDRRYDWSSYRSRYGDRYRIGRYAAPRGWNYGYQRFSVGIFLDSLLYGNSYWLNDPYSYRLPPAYGTLRWIRYYDDALLVDIRDGYVVDVINNFFW